jgi:hypothetical protein
VLPWPLYKPPRTPGHSRTSSPRSQALSVTAKRAPTVSSIFHLAPADPGHAIVSLGYPAPPSLYLEMLSQGVNSLAWIPRVNPLLNHPPDL